MVVEDIDMSMLILEIVKAAFEEGYVTCRYSGGAAAQRSCEAVDAAECAHEHLCIGMDHKYQQHD